MGGNGARFHPIIERNSPVPISRVDRFYTARDWQTQIMVNIFQGESRLVKDNIKLGEITLDVPRAPRGKESIDVRFTYDVSGLLEVDLTLVSSGVRKNLLIEGNPGTLSEDEIQQRLKDLSRLKIHPRENSANALLIARGERIYEQSRGDLREYIGQCLTQFEKILNRQNPEEVEQSAQQIKQIFDDIDGR